MSYFEYIHFYVNQPSFCNYFIFNNVILKKLNKKIPFPSELQVIQVAFGCAIAELVR